MEYFSLQPDSQLHLMQIYSTRADVIRFLLKKEKSKIPAQTMFQVKEIPKYGMPDIVFSPALLVSQLFLKCMRVYQPYVKAVPVFLCHAEGLSIYYILTLPEIGAEQGEVDELHHLYECVGQKGLVISLDLAESLLRRRAFGFQLEEIKC